MTLKLNGSSSGYTAIDAPAAAGSNTLVLPADNGSANEVLKSDGSGNLDWVAQGSGLFSAYALIEDQKSSGTQGGTAETGAWRTRDLNTEVADAGSIVSIASNQFTLQAGTYLIKWRAPAYNVDNHRSRLADTTNTAYWYGSNEFQTAENDMSNSFGAVRVTISGAAVFEIQHQVLTTANSMGFGVAWSTLGVIETYTAVEIYKEA